jgi:shikimate dehydrogenase
MAPEAEVPLLFDETVLNRRQLVYDTIYIPRRTRLLKVAEEKGCKILDGAEMLVLQGARSFELWTGQSAPVDVMRKALLQALSEGSKSI